MLAAMRQLKRQGVPNYTWATAAPTPAPAPGNPWRQLAYGPPGFVLTNFTQCILSSDSGMTWGTPVNLPLLPNERVQSISYGGGRYIATAVNNTSILSGCVLYSLDGVSWTRVSTSPALIKIQFLNGIFLGFASSNSGGTGFRPAKSNDGTSWAYSSDTRPATGSDYFFSYGNGAYLFSSRNNYSLSSDGLSWPTTNGWGGGEPYWAPIAYGNGFFLTGATLTTPSNSKKSFDGINWANKATSLSLGRVTNAIFTGTKFVLISDNTSNATAITSDGESYVNSLPFSQTGRGIVSGASVYGAGKIMVVTEPFVGGAPQSVFTLEID